MNPDEKQFADEHEAFAAALADDGDAAPAAIQQPVDQPGEGHEDDGGEQQGDDGQGTPEGVDNAENTPQPAPEDEIIASLPEAARAYVESLRNRSSEMESQLQSTGQELARWRNDHASMAGKLRPLQQKLAEYERHKQAPQATAPSPAQPGVAPQATVDTLDAFLQTDRWKQYAATFPEEAAVWLDGQRAMTQAAEQIARREAERVAREIEGRYSPVLTEISTERAQSAHAKAIEQLASEHPDWQRIDGDQSFWSWFDNSYLPEQLDVVQQAFSDQNYTKRQLSNPSFVSKLLSQYKAHAGISAQPVAPTQPQPTATTPARLAVAASPNVRPTAPVSRMAIERMTPEQAFQAALNSDD